MGSSQSSSTLAFPQNPTHETKPVDKEPNRSHKRPDQRLDQFFDSFRVISRSSNSCRCIVQEAEDGNAEQDIWTGFTCFHTELPPEMMRLILSFLSPIELLPLRFVSKSFHLLIEQVMEQWVKSRQHSAAHGDNNNRAGDKALFTAFDFESGLYSDVFGSWADVARSGYLYEQLVPSCCTSEEIEQLKNSRMVSQGPSTSPMIKVSIIGRENAGKTMWCQYVTSDRTIGPHSYEPTIGANFTRSSFSIDSKTVHTLAFWDTSGQDRYRTFIPVFLRNAVVVLIMIPLDGSSTSSIEWLEDILATHCLQSEMKCIVVGTKSDLKKDNRLSYDLLSHCTRRRIPYYECNLTDSNQMFRVLYAMIHYGL